jgi:phenylpropionate dioxygenase-like ring-hydroxylating dioxygenase large terminal subunit
VTPVALSPDIEPDSACPVIVDGAEIVLWRGGGTLQAWEDRCPHRGMRLSFGFVRGGQLACLYHGWRWRADGGCAHIPAHPDLEPPQTLRVRAFACAERDGLVWLGEGEPPALGPARPVRSLTVQAPRAAVEAALGGWSRLAPGLWAMGGRRLGVRAKTAAATTLHLLSDADPVAESRWAEAFRAAIEAAP